MPPRPLSERENQPEARSQGPAAFAGTMPAAAGSPSRAGRLKDLDRFDGVERAVHWSTALLVLVLLFTGSVLYVPALALIVGHRAIVENIHVVAGLASLVPLLAGVLGPWRERLLTDLRRFDQWGPADFDWFRRPTRRLHLPRGKFNGGQKAEAAFLGGAMVVMLATGSVMRFAPSRFVTLATGATLVHDTAYIALFVAVAMHIFFALGRPEQLKSMFTGKVPRAWALHHAPAWLEEIEASGSNEVGSNRGRSPSRPG
jgi:formate dehydrogenase subunit gamma